MRHLSKVAIAGLLAAGLAGAAAAATAKPVHMMSVPLPDGTVARVQYVGDVAPHVTVVPVAVVPWVPVAAADGDGPLGFAMPDFGAMFGQMDRQMAAAMQQIDELSRQPAAAGPAGASMASFGGAPAGVTSYSSVTVSQDGRQCSRSTEVVGQGPGKAPKVTSHVSGDCDAAPRQVPQGSGAPAPVVVPDGPVHQS